MKTTEITWVCADPKPMPPMEELLTMSGRELFDLYMNAWLGHEDCWKTVRYNKEKVDADIAARAVAEKK
jgi:hypothetical protein